VESFTLSRSWCFLVVVFCLLTLNGWKSVNGCGYTDASGRIRGFAFLPSDDMKNYTFGYIPDIIFTIGEQDVSNSWGNNSICQPLSHQNDFAWPSFGQNGTLISSFQIACSVQNPTAIKDMFENGFAMATGWEDGDTCGCSADPPPSIVYVVGYNITVMGTLDNGWQGVYYQYNPSCELILVLSSNPLRVGDTFLQTIIAQETYNTDTLGLSSRNFYFLVGLIVALLLCCSISIAFVLILEWKNTQQRRKRLRQQLQAKDNTKDLARVNKGGIIELEENVTSRQELSK